MANILNIKPLIRNFIVDNVHDSVKDSVYWIGERINVAHYPYCILNVISENKDKPTSTEQGKYNWANEERPVITTLYKNAVITISFYSAWIKNVYEIGDADINKEFIYSEINKIEKLFEAADIQQYFYPCFSIQNVGSIRPVHQTIDGGFEYRFEFDLTIGYEDKNIDNVEIGRIIEVDIAKNKKEHNIHFEIISDE